MYYREDIFKQLGLTVPTTWEEFKDCAITIQRNKMQVWLPYTQIQATTTVNVGIGGLSIFPTLMAQNGLSLFNKEFNGSNLNTKESISVFNTWTDFYTEYKIPKEASFYNRFRVGTMPLGIDTYLLYQTLNSAAPEIKGRWKIAPLPGVINADNTINNSSTGSGTGNVIINGTGKEELAWEFLKWWTSADIQVRYSNNLESILGPVGRIDTANVEALSRLSWTKKDLGILMEQWEKVVEVNEIPGSYYLTRALDQAFWNVTNGQATSKDAILEWSMVADNEIKRKIEEYGTQPKEKK
jgi:ABC-type glycerol-3-phosphate transport system substrate-binding protein